jgi:hypothetical protein
MNTGIYCLVDDRGQVYVKDGAESHAEIAADVGLDEAACQAYRFDLTDRRLLIDRGTPGGDRAIRTYVDQRVGTPQRLVACAQAGHLPKRVLVNLLTTSNRRAYLASCAAIEKHYTEECTAQHDPCLESGCAVEGDICLQPVLRAGLEYHKACAAEWATMFANPRHRIDAWRNGSGERVETS